MTAPVWSRSVARGGLILAALSAWGCGGGVNGVEQIAVEPERTREPALPGPWLGSFESGLDADEQLWLLPMSGAPVSVLPPNDHPSRLQARGTFGYSDQSGYVSQVSFDATRMRLTVWSGQAPGGTLRWLDLKTGRWSSLEAGALESALFDSDRGTTILTSDGSVATILAAGDAGFEAVGEVNLDPENPLSHLSSMRVQRFDFSGVQHLLVAAHGGAPLRIGHFERAAEGWCPAPPLLPAGSDAIWVSASSDGARLCAVAADQSSWLISREGALPLDAQLPAGRCGFSSTAERVWFSEWYYRGKLWVGDRAGSRLAEIDDFVPQANAGQFAYGSHDGRLQRLDWNTLELQTLASPEWCATREGLGTGIWHTVHLIGSVAVVENDCGCIDCHNSGVYVLPLAQGSSAEPLVPPQEWEILQIAQLADGSALIAQRWREAVDHVSIATGGDYFLRVAPDGNVTQLGPFPGVPSPLHGPASAL